MGDASASPSASRPLIRASVYHKPAYETIARTYAASALTALTFTSGNWNTPQTATVTGVDDKLTDGNMTYTIITAPASSADPTYNGRAIADVTVINDDNELRKIFVPIIRR